MELFHKIKRAIKKRKRQKARMNPSTALKKGTRGEQKVAKQLRNELVINNMLFRCKNGATCQIDHIVITPGGIIVIETKSHEGRIYGTADQQYWTETFKHSKEKFRLYNPIKQNETHIKHLKEIIDNNIPIYNVVVFTKADTKHIDAKGIYTPKTARKIIDYIAIQPKITREQAYYTYRQLLYIRSTCNVSEQEHITNVQKQKLY